MGINVLITTGVILIYPKIKNELLGLTNIQVS